MDNITHTLAGIAVAELAYQVRAARSGPNPALRGAAWLSAGLASNAPDLDIVLTPLLRQPLGYVLHHRGYTHTLLLAPLLALLPFLLAHIRLARTGKSRVTGLDGAFLYALALASVLLHVLMDFGNSYGVRAPVLALRHALVLRRLHLHRRACSGPRSRRRSPSSRTAAPRGPSSGGIAALGLVLSALLPMVSYVGLAFVLGTTLSMLLLARNAGPARGR